MSDQQQRLYTKICDRFREQGLIENNQSILDVKKKGKPMYGALTSMCVNEAPTTFSI
jgi:hypothetical protein